MTPSTFPTPRRLTCPHCGGSLQVLYRPLGRRLLLLLALSFGVGAALALLTGRQEG
jgi:hypothetical protein